jgi:hypothetical protein
MGNHLYRLNYADSLVTTRTAGAPGRAGGPNLVSAQGTYNLRLTSTGS